MKLQRYLKGILALVGTTATALVGVDTSSWQTFIPAAVTVLAVTLVPNSPMPPSGPESLALARTAAALYRNAMKTAGYEIPKWEAMTETERTAWVRIARVLVGRLKLDEVTYGE